jgi:hypothetical protein
MKRILLFYLMSTFLCINSISAQLSFDVAIAGKSKGKINKSDLLKADSLILCDSLRNIGRISSFTLVIFCPDTSKSKNEVFKIRYEEMKKVHNGILPDSSICEVFKNNKNGTLTEDMRTAILKAKKGCEINFVSLMCEITDLVYIGGAHRNGITMPITPLTLELE